MSKTTIFIGIDPDIEKSGVAVWDTSDKSLELRTLSFWDLIEEIESYLVPVHIVIEAGWLIEKSNWHSKRFHKGSGQWVEQSIGAREATSKNVGMNHSVGILLVQYCLANKIEYSLQKPMGKVNAQVFKSITGFPKRTNAEMRDAGMLVFGIVNSKERA